MTDINTKCTETNLGPDLAVGAHTFTPADGGCGGRGGRGWCKNGIDFPVHFKQSLRKITINEDGTVQAHIVMTTEAVEAILP
jgi:hypothetical protein